MISAHPGMEAPKAGLRTGVPSLGSTGPAVAQGSHSFAPSVPKPGEGQLEDVTGGLGLRLI